MLASVGLADECGERLREIRLTGVPDDVLAKDDSLQTDALLLAETIVGGADLFVTRDKNVVTYLGPTAAEGRDFAVLYPDELPAFIDRRADAASYLPVRLEETQFQVSRGDAATWNPENLTSLIDKDSGRTEGRLQDPEPSPLRRDCCHCPGGSIGWTCTLR